MARARAIVAVLIASLVLAAFPLPLQSMTRHAIPPVVAAADDDLALLPPAGWSVSQTLANDGDDGTSVALNQGSCHPNCAVTLTFTPTAGTFPAIGSFRVLWSQTSSFGSTIGSVQLNCAGTVLWSDASGFHDNTWDTGRIPVTGTMSPQTSSFSCTWFMFSTFSAGSLHVFTISLWEAATASVPIDNSALYGSANSAAPQVPYCQSGDAVNCATGNFSETFTELRIPGRGLPVGFALTYNSLAAAESSVVGYGWTFNYGSRLVVGAGTATVVLGNGSRVSFTLVNGAYRPPAWVIASLTQNADGTFTYLEKRTQRSYTFSSAGQLMSEKDRNGYATTLTYTAGQLTTVSDPAGRALTFSYGTNGKMSTVTDPASRQVVLTYNASDELTDIGDVGGGHTVFTYDTTHHVLTMRDPRGGLVTNTYDTLGRVTRQVDAMNRSMTWDYAAGSTTITDGRGNQILEQFTNNEVTSVTRGYGTAQAATWTYTYDPAVLGVKSVTDPNDHTTNLTWDASGNLLTRTDALNRTTRYTYDSLSNVTSMTEPLGFVTNYTYDAVGNLLTQSRALAGTTDVQTVTITYGDPIHAGDVTSITDALGHAWSFTYDATGNLTAATDPRGNKTTYGYDLVGRRTSMVSPNGTVAGGNPAQYTTTYGYDAFGDVTTITDPQGHITSATYDPNRNLHTLTNPNQRTTSYDYNADNQLTLVTRADGTTLQNGYDAAGNLTSQTDGKNQTTTYTYDPLNRLASMIDPLLRTTSYLYDAAGNLTQLTDASSRATTFTYDNANERTGVTFSSANTPNISYGYDANGRRTSMSDGTGQTNYTYDSLNRLKSVQDGAGRLVGYNYDLNNNITSVSYPTGNEVTYAFDDANRMSGLIDWLGNSFSFAYDANGNLTRIGYPNTTESTFTLDSADQLSQITHSAGTSFASFGYTRDPAGLLTSVTPTGVSQPNEAYTYNPLSQLATVNGATFGYDAADNIVQIPGATLTYDAADQLKTFAQGASTTNFTSDTLGNRTSRTSPTGAVTSYTYDQANRLIGTTVPGSTASVASGSFHSLAVRGDGTVWAWGRNSFGALGNGTTNTTANPLPVQVSNMSGAVAVAAGGYFSMALKSDGTAWAWGNNQYGQLGDGTTTLRSTPVRVGTLAGVTAIAAGCDHGLALKSDGTVWAWGFNGDGELGTGNVTNSSTPVQTNISGVTSIAAGCFHSLAIKSDGTVWTWGDNHNGQLGIGTTRDSSTPVQVTALSSITAVGGGSSHSLAVTSSGTVWAWGYNGAGQLGNGTIRQSTTPVQVSNLTNARRVAGGGNFSLATTASGAVWTWGQNTYGQLGNGTTNDSRIPVQTSNLTGAVAISAGTHHSFAATTSGLPFDWGNNQYGQLGNGSTTNSSTPVQVNNLTNLLAQTSLSYTYNGDGLRMSKTVNDLTKAFTWDMGRRIPTVLQDADATYVYGPGGLALEQIDNSGTRTFLHHDQLGSTRVLTNVSGAVVGIYSFDAYGATTSHTGTVSTPLQFAGQYSDAETSLYYMRARYYDPATAQFITRDPVPFNSRQPYTYVNDSPLNATDSLGLWPDGYQFSWALGYANTLGSSPEQIMRYFQQNAWQIFPFSLGQCTGIKLNARCDLVTPGPWADSPVEVSACDLTSFTFTALPGHFDPAGSTITFSVYQESGVTYLRQTAVWNLHNLFEGIKALTTVPGAEFTWWQQAMTLSSTINPKAWADYYGSPTWPLGSYPN